MNIEQKFTARQWLERTLPEGGEWRRSPNPDIVMYHEYPNMDGVLFTKGRIDNMLLPVEGNPADYELDTIIPRSTAIDLMVAAIEAGDATEASVNEEESAEAAARRFAGQLEEARGLIAKMHARVRGEGADNCVFCVAIKPSGNNQDCPMCHLCQLESNAAYDGQSDTKPFTEQELDKYVKVALSGKASKQPTPAPSFGGPHDAEAVKWAEERGYKVVAWRMVDVVDKYIANSFRLSDDVVYPWSVLEGADAYVPETARYILTPLAKDEPVKEAEKGIDPQRLGQMVDAFVGASVDLADAMRELLAEMRKAVSDGK